MPEREPELTPPLEEELAASGVAELDQAMGGLFWGDNVVFQVVDGAGAEPFYRAVASSDVAYERRLAVCLERPAAPYPGFEVIDARAGGKLAQPAPLLHAVFERCRGTERNLDIMDEIMALRKEIADL